ncbi:hypothetical protein, partial [uncultured Thiodictyon sp.]|uniref:hypothetical protein n=1 Tax=uncultured Thiodictyon sp. TaxID=1846217 RepID=UPI0025D1BFAC
PNLRRQGIGERYMHFEAFGSGLTAQIRSNPFPGTTPAGAQRRARRERLNPERAVRPQMNANERK